MINLQSLDGWKDLNSYKSFDLSSNMSQNNNYVLENSEGNVLSFLDSEDSDIAQQPSESKILCACGCERETSGKWNAHSRDFSKYINNHHRCGNPQKLSFNPEQEQILLGSLLGDGHISNIQKNKCYYYGEEHGIKQKDYLLWKNSYLKFNFFKSQDKNKSGQMNKANLVFKTYRDLFYPNGKKIVTREILDKLEPLGLAVWYLDDGCYGYGGKYIQIATHCFGLEGNQIIQQYLKEKWNVNSNIRKNYPYYYIAFNVENTKKFIEIIKSYTLQIPSMTYKIGLDREKMENFRIKKNDDRKIYYRNNKEKISEIVRKYYLKNKSKIDKKHLEYYLKNKDIIKQQHKNYYFNNKEKILEQNKKNYIKNQEQKLSQKKEHYLKNKAMIQIYRGGYYFKNRNKLIENTREYYKKNRDKILKQKKENYFKTLNKEENKINE